MLVHPAIDPVAIQLGFLKIHWYGIMYLIGFGATWVLGRLRIRQSMNPVVTEEQLNDLIFYAALGVILGGRLGYVLFYDLPSFLKNPDAIIKIWQGGMSFHGGFLGVLIAIAWYASTIQRKFFELTDFIAPFVPLALAAGRIGNFINGELWGRPTDVPWGMVFQAVDELPRHPSQLYQAALEGITLFIILWLFSKKPRPLMAVSCAFLIGYGFFRFLAEFFRTPDAHIGFIAFNWLTMGQLLTLPMVIVGIILLRLAYKNQR
jgi:phosphatidylglycerol:prolipoprotein diacylglycerol transferase